LNCGHGDRVKKVTNIVGKII